MLAMAVATAFLPVLAWLLVAVKEGARGGPAGRPPPLRAGSPAHMPAPASKPHDRERGSLRDILTQVLAPERLAAYSSVGRGQGGRAWLSMPEDSDCLSRWMRLGRSEAQQEITCLLQAWVSRASPGSQDLADFSNRVLAGFSWQRHCAMPQLLLLSDVVATVSHLVRSGRSLHSDLEELAQISHLLARWHMPDHLQTRRGSNTWLQWLAVLVPSLWLVLLWSMQLRAGTRRARRARRGTRFLHPLVQLALSRGCAADCRARGALDEFLARQCLLVVSPPPGGVHVRPGEPP